MENERPIAVIARLATYVRSPSLTHIRDPHNLHRIAKDILLAVDRAGSIWTNWEGRREDVVKTASCCWIPVEDLAVFLNSVPGPPLTLTDVKQRLRALWEEAYSEYPAETYNPAASPSTRPRGSSGGPRRVAAGPRRGGASALGESIRGGVPPSSAGLPGEVRGSSIWEAKDKGRAGYSSSFWLTRKFRWSVARARPKLAKRLLKADHHADCRLVGRTHDGSGRRDLIPHGRHSRCGGRCPS